MVRNLLRGGQNPKEQTQSMRNTPLHIAAKHGHLLIVKYLIEHGAQGHLANANGMSALDLAQESQELIQSQAINTNSKNHLAKGVSQEEAQALMISLENVKMLIQRVAPMDQD